MIDDNGQRIQAFEFVARFESILLHALPSQIKLPLAASVSRSLMESGVLVVGPRWDTKGGGSGGVSLLEQWVLFTHCISHGVAWHGMGVLASWTVQGRRSGRNWVPQGMHI